VILRNTEYFSHERHAAMFVLKDIATKFRMSFAAVHSNNADDAEICLRDFIGTETLVKFYSDNSRELIEVAERLGVLHPTSTAYRPQSNADAENEVQQVLNGSRALLAASGMPLSTWNYAAPFFCLMSNVENGAFEKRFGEKFQAVCFPFGGEIEFRPPGERNEVIPVHKFSGNNVPGIFLGYRLQPGMVWSGDYTVVSRDDLLAYVSGQTADFRVHHVPEVRFPDGVKFPDSQRPTDIEP
jgi:transposase InsO family protein